MNNPLPPAGYRPGPAAPSPGQPNPEQFFITKAIQWRYLTIEQVQTARARLDQEHQRGNNEVTLLKILAQHLSQEQITLLQNAYNKEVANQHQVAQGNRPAPFLTAPIGVSSILGPQGGEPVRSPATPPVQQQGFNPALLPAQASPTPQQPSQDNPGDAAIAALYEARQALGEHGKYLDPTTIDFGLLEELGRGGMGVVNKVMDSRLGREAALKLMLPGAAIDPDNVARFIREAEITARLDHPAIPPVYGFGSTAKGEMFMLMRMIGGENFLKVLSRFHDGQVKFGERSEKEIRGLLEIFAKVIEAIRYAHSRGIVHRDLKPENIMVGKFGEVYAMDWGLAGESHNVPDDAQGQIPRAVDKLDISFENNRLTLSKETMGTPEYMSPEQWWAYTLNGKTDVYALGVILSMILTGRKPITGQFVNEIAERATRHSQDPSGNVLDARIPGVDIFYPNHYDGTIPPELNALVIEALKLNRKERLSIDRLLELTQDYLAGRDLDIYEYPLKERIKRGIRRNPARVAGGVAGGLGAMMIVIVTMIMTIFIREAKQNELLAKEKAKTAEKDKEAAKTIQRESEATTAKILKAFKLLQKAKYSLDRGQIDQTAKLVDQALGITDISMLFPDVYPQSADIYASAGDFDKAQALLEEAIKLNQNPTNVYQLLFKQHLLEMKKLGETKSGFTDYLRQIIQIAKEKGDVNEFTLFADALEASTKNAETAIELYSKAIEKNPALAIAYINRGHLYKEKSDKDNALQDFSKAVETDPNYPIARFNLAATLKDFGKLQESLDELNRAIELDSRFARAYSLRGIVRSLLEDYNGALSDFNRAVKLNPRDYEAITNRGNIYLESNNFAKARAEFEKSLEMEPKQAIANYGLAGIAVKENNLEAALGYYNKVLSLRPVFPFCYYDRGKVKYGLKDFDGAELDFRKAIEQDSEATEFWLALADNYVAQKKYKEALLCHRTFLKQAPANHPQRRQSEELARRLEEFLRK